MTRPTITISPDQNLFFEFIFEFHYDNELYLAFKRDTDLMFEGKYDQIKDVDPNLGLKNEPSHDHGHGASAVCNHSSDHHDDHHNPKHEEADPDEDPVIFLLYRIILV